MGELHLDAGAVAIVGSIVATIVGGIVATTKLLLKAKDSEVDYAKGVADWARGQLDGQLIERINEHARRLDALERRV